MSTIASKLRDKVVRNAGNRCGYCLSRQGLVPDLLEIDHIVPVAVGGSDEEKNLWLACRACNRAKGKQREARDPLTQQTVALYNPREQGWWEHFCWSQSGVKIIGITPIGRATVAALHLNNMIALIVRRNWVRSGWHPPAL